MKNYPIFAEKSATHFFMKDINFGIIATHAIRFFLAIIALSFAFEVVVQLAKGASFADAFAYWQIVITNQSKLIVYIVASIAFGIYKSRKDGQVRK